MNHQELAKEYNQRIEDIEDLKETLQVKNEIILNLTLELQRVKQGFCEL